MRRACGFRRKKERLPNQTIFRLLVYHLHAMVNEHTAALVKTQIKKLGLDALVPPNSHPYLS